MGRCYLLDLTKFLLDGAIYFFMTTKSLRRRLVLLLDRNSVALSSSFSCCEQAYLSVT